MKKVRGAKIIVSFIENMSPDRGWWCTMPRPDKGDDHKGSQSVTSLISAMFGFDMNGM